MPLPRPCRKCGKKFQPKTKCSWLCDDCHEKTMQKSFTRQNKIRFEKKRKTLRKNYCSICGGVYFKRGRVGEITYAKHPWPIRNPNSTVCSKECSNKKIELHNKKRLKTLKAKRKRLKEERKKLKSK
jgi:hypothetical protein